MSIYIFFFVHNHYNLLTILPLKPLSCFGEKQCGHCQTIEPEWEKMAREWKDHTQGFVGEIDI